MSKTDRLIARIEQVQLRDNTAPENHDLLQEIIEYLQTVKGLSDKWIVLYGYDKYGVADWIKEKVNDR